MLLEMDLIDVGDDYYNEEILFSDPDQLMEIYSQLEEQNLKKINECQDIELQLELQQQLDKEVRQVKGDQIKAQLDLKRETQDKIKEAKAQLLELQKMNQLMQASSNQDHKKKDDENPEPDYNQLMVDLKGKIIDVYKEGEGVQNDSDLAAK